MLRLKIQLVSCILCFVQINDLVDARDMNMGAWFEAQVVNVTRKKAANDSCADPDQQTTIPEEDVIYHVKYEE